MPSIEIITSRHKKVNRNLVAKISKEMRLKYASVERSGFDDSWRVNKDHQRTT